MSSKPGTLNEFFLVVRARGSISPSPLSIRTVWTWFELEHNTIPSYATRFRHFFICWGNEAGGFVLMVAIRARRDTAPAIFSLPSRRQTSTLFDWIVSLMGRCCRHRTRLKSHHLKVRLSLQIALIRIDRATHTILLAMFIFSIRWDCFQERHVRQVFTRHAFLFRDTYNIGATIFVEVAIGDVRVTFL